MTQFRIWENQSTNLGEFDDKEGAITFSRERHRKHMDRWHEVYRFGDNDMTGVGIAQWKPNDCPECHGPTYLTHNIAEEVVYVCEHCVIEIPYRFRCYFQIGKYCDECDDVGCPSRLTKLQALGYRSCEP